MSRISKVRKESILNTMMSPYTPTIAALSKQESVSEATLYKWRKKMLQGGRPAPKYDRNSENWSAQMKFAAVVETVTMTKTELDAYCRSKDLYPLLKLNPEQNPSLN